LASKGWKVAVVEGAPEPGGSVKTREVTLPGFRHDLFATNLSLFAGSPFFAAYKDKLIAHGLALVTAEDCFASAFADDTWLGVSKDAAATAKRIAQVSPRDAERWRAMLAEFASDAPHLFALLGVPMPSWAAARVVWNMYRARGISWIGDLLRMLLSSPREFLDAQFDSEKLKAMMAVWGMHLDFAPDVRGGALYPFLQCMQIQSTGLSFGKGGAATLIAALTGLFAEAGGELRLSSPVSEIVIERRAAVAAVSAGARFDARSAVIANVTPAVLFRLTKQTLSSRPYRYGPGTMMIHLALSDLPDWRARPARDYAYVHITPSLAAMSAAYDDALRGVAPREPVLIVAQPTVVDPTRAPAGRHILSIQVRPLPAVVEKERYADHVIDIVERYAPGLRRKILGRHVIAPVDLEHSNPNLVGGDSLGGSHHLGQQFIFRPFLGWSRYRTPINGLFVCGASTWPGAGVGAGSGWLLGQMLAQA
jgi:phytoene dehydrogenase-like protein